MPRESDNSSEKPLAEAVGSCNEAFLDALRDVYREVDAVVAATVGTNCHACGGCCNFHQAGHRLYVSTGELALLLRLLPPEGAEVKRRRCSYQVDQHCAARDGRALGCRVYFCRPPEQGWCERTYEVFHRRIRDLHDRHGVPYLYVELTTAIDRIRPSE